MKACSAKQKNEQWEIAAVRSIQKSEGTMRSNKEIAALVQTALVTAALTAGMITAAPMFGQTSQVDNPDWPLLRETLHQAPVRHTQNEEVRPR
jgi:hypothetical protein